jgi:hypothetical protein
LEGVDTVYYSELFESRHKRQSSVCKWQDKNGLSFGIIHKFIVYNDQNFFIASKFKSNVKITDFKQIFSENYNKIFELNNIAKYFPVFEKYQYNDINTVVCKIESIVSTCVMSNVNDSDYSIVTPLIGFEHD